MERSLIPSLSKQLRSKSTSPWNALSQMEEEMQRWFEGANFLPSGFYDAVDFVPQCDFRETKKEYVARFDIPGVKKQDLKIEVDGNRLTVRGERKSEKEEKDDRCYFSETSCGSFLRTFTLPSQIKESSVDAHYEDGVLTIKVPKMESTKAKEIAIH